MLPISAPAESSSRTIIQAEMHGPGERNFSGRAAAWQRRRKRSICTILDHFLFAGTKCKSLRRLGQL